MRYSKREVSRAGSHLAERIALVRSGQRELLVDTSDPRDLRARLIVEWWLGEHLAPMLAVYDVVVGLSPELELGEGRAVHAVSFRPKRFETTVEKLTREPGKLADMADLGGVRAVVNDQDEVDALAEQIQRTLDVRRVRDWARKPRSSGYRAVHLHVREGGRLIEVQLRTFGQDAWANVVEEESLRSGLNYKAGQGDPAVLEFFRLSADMFGAFELGESHPDLAPRLHRAFARAKPLLRTPTLRDLGS